MTALPLTNLLIGAGLAAVIAVAAYIVKLLSISGAIAAFILGAVVFGFGGLGWALVLIIFFVSSSGLSWLFKNKKKELSAQFSKGSRRDAGQVIANGGFAGVAVLVHVFYPDLIIPWVVFASAFAAANADTWATELGVLSRKPPRSVTTWKIVPVGTSGGVSLVGTAALVSGALLIALTFYAVTGLANAGIDPLTRIVLSGLVLVSGIVGAFVDSILGATLQAIYWCPVCLKETEKFPVHGCGTTTLLIKGWKWFDNDWVNGFCTLSAVITSLVLTIILV